MQHCRRSTICDRLSPLRRVPFRVLRHDGHQYMEDLTAACRRLAARRRTNEPLATSWQINQFARRRVAGWHPRPTQSCALCNSDQPTLSLRIYVTNSQWVITIDFGARPTLQPAISGRASISLSGTTMDDVRQLELDPILVIGVRVFVHSWSVNWCREWRVSPNGCCVLCQVWVQVSFPSTSIHCHRANWLMSYIIG